MKVDAALRDKPWRKDMPVCFDDTTRAITRANESFVTHSVSLPVWLHIPLSILVPRPLFGGSGLVTRLCEYAPMGGTSLHVHQRGGGHSIVYERALMFVLHSWLAELHTENVARGEFPKCRRGKPNMCYINTPKV